MFGNIREEELKNKIAERYFKNFDTTEIIKEIDFCVKPKEKDFKEHSFLWAEAKRGTPDIIKSFIQLILTIGKKKLTNQQIPPKFLGAFDYEKIAFVEYNAIEYIFRINDFNWNVRPSDHNTKEFELLCNRLKNIETEEFVFNYQNYDKELKDFIKQNFHLGTDELNRMSIDEDNFMHIFFKWQEKVKPSIDLSKSDWKKIKEEESFIEGDFYLADLLSEDNKTLKEKLFLVLEKDKYKSGGKKINKYLLAQSYVFNFNDNQKAHNQFWNKYKRPPLEKYWDKILKRRDLLVPQDIREKKGSFFTPPMWVEKSQEYLRKTFGEGWQENYIIWDCAAGTGNLLAGLINKYKIYASTLDEPDVRVMEDRIENGANLLLKHVFQFDFLQDKFKAVKDGGKMPDSLYKIIKDKQQRKKLIIYINPPYAEGASRMDKAGKLGLIKKN